MSMLLNRILIVLFFFYPVTILTGIAGGNFVQVFSIIIILLCLFLKKDNILKKKDYINYFNNNY